MNYRLNSSILSLMIGIQLLAFLPSSAFAIGEGSEGEDTFHEISLVELESSPEAVISEDPVFELYRQVFLSWDNPPNSISVSMDEETEEQRVRSIRDRIEAEISDLKSREGWNRELATQTLRYIHSRLQANANGEAAEAQDPAHLPQELRDFLDSRATALHHQRSKSAITPRLVGFATLCGVAGSACLGSASMVWPLMVCLNTHDVCPENTADFTGVACKAENDLHRPLEDGSCPEGMTPISGHLCKTESGLVPPVEVHNFPRETCYKHAGYFGAMHAALGLTPVAILGVKRTYHSGCQIYYVHAMNRALDQIVAQTGMPRLAEILRSVH